MGEDDWLEAAYEERFEFTDEYPAEFYAVEIDRLEDLEDDGDDE